MSRASEKTQEQSEDRVSGNDGLPKGWIELPLAEIAEINPRHPNTIDDEIPVSFVPMSYISESGWRFESTDERKLGDVRKGYTHFSDGDVLFAKITPCMENGKAAVALDLLNGMGCGTTEVHVLRSKGAINPKFLYYFIHQDSFRKVAASNFTGTAGQLRVPTTFMRMAIVPLPPLAEQRRIVAKLEALLEKVDACKKRLDRIPTLLKRFRQSVLAAACSGKLTEDWRGENDGEAWKEMTIGELETFIGSGITPRGGKAVYKSTGIPFIRSQNVYPTGLVMDDVAYISREMHRQMSRTHLRPLDVLLNITGASIGRSTVVPSDFSEANVNQHVCIIRVKPDLQPRFLSIYLNSPLGQDLIFGMQMGVTREGLNYGQIRLFSVPLPPVAEQHEIVRRVEQLFSHADQLEARYTKAQTLVDKLTQSILAKAFRGELVPQDPNDEPASVLLERIKASSTSQPKQSIKRSTRKTRTSEKGSE